MKCGRRRGRRFVARSVGRVEEGEGSTGRGFHELDKRLKWQG